MFLRRYASASSIYSYDAIFSLLRNTNSGNKYYLPHSGIIRSAFPRRFCETSIFTKNESALYFNRHQCSYYCSTAGQKPLSSKDKLKQAVKDYGTTIIVFHVTISLASLGCCYVAIYSGVDITDLLNKMNLNSNQQLTNVTGGVSTFVIAYAVHKVFAPIRIGITLTAAPILVRYLRKIGILKPPKI